MKETCFSVDFPTEIVTEGKAKLLVPKLKAFAKMPSDYAPSKAPVFYNPVMELNRDIAVLALQAYQKTANQEISVCEPLAGCGLRGVRFAVEVEGVKRVVMNDISRKATQIASINVHMNKVEKKVVVKNKEANVLLSNYAAPHKRFDAVDVDPFGSPVPYLDSTIRAIRNHGLLALTATDMAPLCGVHPKACIRKYSGKPLRADYCHELAVRLLAGCLATTAARYGIGMRVVFSHCSEHYIRVYAVMEYGAMHADESLKNMGFTLHCFKCFHHESLSGSFLIGYSEKCSECGSKLNAAGPLWLGRVFDRSFCEYIEEETKHRKFRLRKRIMRILASMKNDVEVPVGFYVVDKLCDMLNLPVPSAKQVIQALRKKGYQASATHFNPKGIRSDASAAVMKELIQEIVSISK